MSNREDERDPSDPDDATDTQVATEPDAEDQGGEPEKRKLDLEAQITDTAPCKKHIKITIPRAEIEKQFEESLGSMKKEAQVPGFRPGRAPKTLVQKRFRKEVAGQVKSSL